MQFFFYIQYLRYNKFHSKLLEERLRFYYIYFFNINFNFFLIPAIFGKSCVSHRDEIISYEVPLYIHTESIS